MRLEPLELVERREVRVRVVEVDDEADRHQVVAEVVEERAAAGPAVERPALRVQHQPRTVQRRVDLPELLDADAVLLRVDAVAQVEPGHQLLRQRAAAAFAEQRVLRAQLHPALELGLGRTVARDPEVAGGHAGDRPLVVEQHLRGGEAGVDLDAERLGFAREPAADVAQAGDVHPVVAHQRRQESVRDAPRFLGAEDQEAVVGHRGVERGALRLPVREQLLHRARVHDRARQDMGADFRALLEHADRDFATVLGGKLLEADRGGEAGRASADDHHVVLHRLAFRCHRCSVVDRWEPRIPRPKDELYNAAAWRRSAATGRWPSFGCSPPRSPACFPQPLPTVDGTPRVFPPAGGRCRRLCCARVAQAGDRCRARPRTAHRPAARAPRHRAAQRLPAAADDPRRPGAGPDAHGDLRRLPGAAGPQDPARRDGVAGGLRLSRSRRRRVRSAEGRRRARCCSSRWPTRSGGGSCGGRRASSRIARRCWS